jgi:hypothetical protein
VSSARGPLVAVPLEGLGLESRRRCKGTGVATAPPVEHVCQCVENFYTVLIYLIYITYLKAKKCPLWIVSGAECSGRCHGAVVDVNVGRGWG